MTDQPQWKGTQGAEIPPARSSIWGKVLLLVVFAVAVTVGVVWWFTSEPSTPIVSQPETGSHSLTEEELRTLTAHSETATPLTASELKTLTASAGTSKPLTAEELKRLTAAK